MAETTDERVGGPVRRRRARPEPPRPPTLHRLRARVADDLFPPADRARLTPGRVLAVLLAWGLLLGLSLLRQQGAPVTDTVWAEDGQIFLDDALDLSFGRAFTTAYAGYLHLVPRVLAEAVAALDLDLAAVALAVAGAGVAALAGILVFAATAGHLRSQSLRLLLAAMVVLQPSAGPESLNSLALAQWYLVVATFWLTLWRPLRRSAAMLAGVVICATLLSAPLAFLVLPVLAVRALVLPTVRDRMLLAAAVVAAGVQGWALVTQPAPNTPGGSLELLFLAFADRVATTAVFGLGLADTLATLVGREPLTVAACVVLGVVTLVALLRPSGRTRLTALLVAGTAVVAFVGSVYLRGNAEAMLSTATQQSTSASRFVIVPVALVLSLVALVLDQRPPRTGQVPWERLRVGVIAFVLLVAGNDFSVRNDRSEGPTWSAELEAAREVCARPRITAVRMQVAPDVPTFQLTIDCDDLGAPGVPPLRWPGRSPR